MIKKTKLNKFLKIVLIMVVGLTIFFQVIKPTSAYQQADLFFYTTLSRVKYMFIDNPINVIKNTVNDYVSLSTTYQENKKLRENMVEAQRLIDLLSESRRDNLELRELLDLRETMTQNREIVAQVVNRNAQSFNESVLIDVGENAGIKQHMAVITPQGLVGQISKVDENTSVVKLLSSQTGLNQFALKVVIDESTTVEALLESYNPQTNTYSVRLLDSTTAVTVGLKVITSGLGKIIPSGISVGEITEITQSQASFSVILKVKPTVNFSNFNYVMVVSKDD